VFGAATHHDGFLLTAGNGEMARVGGGTWSEGGPCPHDLASAWDNHLVAIG
jgi:hypothetical protein